MYVKESSKKKKEKEKSAFVCWCSHRWPVGGSVTLGENSDFGSLSDLQEPQFGEGPARLAGK